MLIAFGDLQNNINRFEFKYEELHNKDSFMREHY